MNWNNFSRLLFRLGIQLVAAAMLYCLWHRSALHEVTVAESEGTSTLILLIGSIYAVMFAFVIYVIWGQFTDVENFMMRECKSMSCCVSPIFSIPMLFEASGAGSRITSIES